MADITAIFYTANVVHEPFAGIVRNQLTKAIGDLPLISVSQKPMDFGENICIGEIGRSHLNLYRQILIGAKAAKTKYVACAEDDILYSQEHFQIRPRAGNFGYNMNKWSIFTWSNPPVFSYRHRKVVNSLIAERDMLVEALEERFAKYPDDSKVPLKYWGDPGRYENYLGVTVRPTEEIYSKVPNIVFSHEEAFGFLSRGIRKSLGNPQAYEIPVWGKAADIVKLFVNGKSG